MALEPEDPVHSLRPHAYAAPATVGRLERPGDRLPQYRHMADAHGKNGRTGRSPGFRRDQANDLFDLLQGRRGCARQETGIRQLRRVDGGKEEDVRLTDRERGAYRRRTGANYGRLTKKLGLAVCGPASILCKDIWDIACYELADQTRELDHTD